MSYTLHQLRIFDKVARKKSITKAARELNMTQPAVSIQIKQLQEHFDIALTEVIGKQLYLTEAGKRLFEAYKTVESSLENMELDIAHMKGVMKGPLRISVVSNGKYFMPYILGKFKQLHKELNISLKVTNRGSVFQDLKENTTDFAVVSLLPSHFELETIPFLANPLVFAAPPDHPLLNRKKISIKDLKHEQFLLREEDSGTRKVMENMLLDNKISAEVTMEVGTNEAIKQSIMAGMGISLVPLLGLRLELEHNLIGILPVEGFPHKETWHLTWIKGKRLSPVAKEFITFLNVQESYMKQQFDYALKYLS